MDNQITNPAMKETAEHKASIAQDRRRNTKKEQMERKKSMRRVL